MMKHFATPDFWVLYNALPRTIRDLADKNYRMLELNQGHSSLQYKEVKDNLWSVRVGLHYRALAFREEDGDYWFWIGAHAEYDQILSRL